MAEVLRRFDGGGTKVGDRGRVVVVAIGLDLDAPPVARTGVVRRIAAGVGVVNRIAVGIVAGADRRVVKGGEDHRVAGGADNVDRPANTVVHVRGLACGGKAGIRAQKLHHQGLTGAALERQTTGRFLIGDVDLTLDHVDDVGIVPNPLRGERPAANQHSVDRAVRRGGDHLVQPDHRAVVVGELSELVYHIQRIAVGGRAPRAVGVGAR